MSSLQYTMQGNVSSYELDMQGIASMVEGKLMPRPPELLTFLITVTSIKLSQLPKSWMHTTFHVHRQVICDDLVWLKDYSDIEISTSHIKSLPEDNMPGEITSIIQQSDNVGNIEQESEGYVPLNNNECVLSFYFQHFEQKTEFNTHSHHSWRCEQTAYMAKQQYW